VTGRLLRAFIPAFVRKPTPPFWAKQEEKIIFLLPSFFLDKSSGGEAKFQTILNLVSKELSPKNILQITVRG